MATTNLLPPPKDPHAAYRVIAIPELLEQIILYALEGSDERAALGSRMRTIVRSQSVSREFRNTIQGSTKIKRALWMVNIQKPVNVSRINPSLFKSRCVNSMAKGTPFEVLRWDFVEGLHVEMSSAQLPALQGGPESWRQMILFLTDRKEVKVHVDVERHTQCSTIELETFSIVLQLEASATTGDMAKLALAELKREHSTSFGHI